MRALLRHLSCGDFVILLLGLARKGDDGAWFLYNVIFWWAFFKDVILCYLLINADVCGIFFCIGDHMQHIGAIVSIGNDSLLPGDERVRMTHVFL